MMDKLIFNGVISVTEDDDWLIGENYIAKILEESDYDGYKIYLRYTVSKQPISPDTVDESVLLTMYGILGAERGCIPYTAWTGFVAYDNEIKVGNHNLIEELSNYKGQYCYLELGMVDGQ